MAIKTVLFDLDGTLLPMDQDKFSELYFGNLAIKGASLGYDPKTIIKDMWQCVGSMFKNDGSVTNMQAFWNTFCQIHGPEAINDKERFDEFYVSDFNKAQAACGCRPEANEIVKLIKSKGYAVVLATNPLFPATATENRARWAGLDLDDFLLYTTYENSHYCKPNLKYYIEICEKLKLDPNECLMVGNDVGEDMVAEDLGMRVFLLTDCLINKVGKDINQYPHGGFQELIEYINENC